MILNDLAMTGNIDTDKAAIEEKLLKFLPAEKFTVVLRNYGGDFRLRESNQVNYKVLIMVTSSGRQLVLEKKADLLSAGFKVNEKGNISLE